MALLVILLAAAGLALYLLRARPQQSIATGPVLRTAVVSNGSLARILRISGSTSASRFANIAAPLLRGPESGRALTLIFLAKAGSWVKKGELVAQIDAQAARDHVDDVDSMVQQAEADIRKRKAEIAIEQESLRQELNLAKSRLDKAKLDYGAAEIRTSIDQEQLKLSVEQYEAEYKQQMADLRTAEIGQRASLRILELTRDRHARHRDRHAADIVKFTMRAPMDGLVVMLSVWRGGDMGQIQQGDQVAPNQPFMKIVDPTSMQVDASVNQVEGELIRLGQPATVSFDAFSGLSLKGRIFSIGALATGGWQANNYIRNIAVKIQLLEQDSRVIPDLSASADVQVGRKDDVAYVPLEAVHTQGGKSVVYVKRAGGFVTREVDLGFRTNTHAEIRGGLAAGEEVALQQPATARS